MSILSTEQRSKNYLCIDSVCLSHIQGFKCTFTLKGGYAPFLEHGGGGAATGLKHVENAAHPADCVDSNNACVCKYFFLIDKLC